VFDADDEVEDHLWWIPLVVVSQNKLDFNRLTPSRWMEEEARVVLQDLPSSGYFVIVNPEEVGMYLGYCSVHGIATITWITSEPCKMARLGYVPCRLLMLLIKPLSN